MAIDLTTVPRKLRTIPLSAVKPAPFNPPIRTCNRTGDIDELGRSIQEKGQLEPVHAVAHTVNGQESFTLADGNRRRAGILTIGGTTIRAWVYEPPKGTFDEVLHSLFVDLNGDKRRLANRDMVEVGLAGGPIFNSTVKSTVKTLKEIFATDGGIPKIVLESAGSTLLNIAKSTVKYCWPGFKPGSPAFTSRLRVTLLWLVRNKQQQHVTAYKRLHYSPDQLKSAIEDNRLCPRMNVK